MPLTDSLKLNELLNSNRFFVRRGNRVPSAKFRRVGRIIKPRCLPCPSLICLFVPASGNESSNNEPAPLAKGEDLGEESLTSMTSAAGREKHEAESGGGGGGAKEGVEQEVVAKELSVSFFHEMTGLGKYGQQKSNEKRS